MSDQSFVTLFTNSPLYLNGQKYSTIEISSMQDQILAEIKSLPEHSSCFIKDENPLRFSLLFLALIDHGHIPIPYPDLSTFQISSLKKELAFSFIEDGIVTLKAENQSQTNYGSCYASMTSGTTSTPKLCYLSVDGALKNAKAHADAFQIKEDHRILQGLPLYHSYGIIAYIWTKVITNCSLDFCSVFPSLKSLSEREDIQKGVLHLGPAQLKFMLKEKTKTVNGIDIVTCGAGVVSSRDMILIKERLQGAKTYVSYGLTEAGPRVTTGEILQQVEDGFIGQALNGISLYVLDERGKLKEEGMGHLCIKSPSLKLNLNDDEYLKNEGVLKTRDLVEIKNGNVIYLSREDDLIKVGGISIYPRDIENLANSFDHVKDSIVFKKEHKLYGEVPILIVEGEVDQQQLHDFLKERLNVNQIPKKIIVKKQFPRFSLYKIDRKKLLLELGEF